MVCTDLFCVFASGESGFALAAAKCSRVTFVAGDGLDVVHDAIAVGIFTVTNFDCIGVTSGVVVIAITVVGKAIFVSILERTAGSSLAELAAGAVGVTTFLADTVFALFAACALRSTDACTETVVADVSELRARRVALYAENAASTEAGVTLGTSRLATFDRNAATECFVTDVTRFTRGCASDVVAVGETIHALAIDAFLIG